MCGPQAAGHLAVEVLADFGRTELRRRGGLAPPSQWLSSRSRFVHSGLLRAGLAPAGVRLLLVEGCCAAGIGGTLALDRVLLHEAEDESRCERKEPALGLRSADPDPDSCLTGR